MIGLGSNRLTVCRRGGMSVTQAGRGGMEWLAGGRMPRWASLYSAQATAALKAQFPTQWPTIRDYGFAHPALVPFINEDPMLVMSLIEGLGWRKITNGNTAAYIDTGFTPTSNNIRAELGFDINQGSTDPFGFCKINADTEWFTAYSASMACYIGTSGNIFSLGAGTAGIKRDIIIETDSNGKVRYSVNSATLTEKNYSGSLITNPGTFCLFTMSNGVGGSATTSRISKGTSYWYGRIYSDGVLVRNMVPCVHDGNVGMLDVVNAVFHEKQGTGQFTISETPAS